MSCCCFRSSLRPCVCPSVRPSFPCLRENFFYKCFPSHWIYWPAHASRAIQAPKGLWFIKEFRFSEESHHISADPRSLRRGGSVMSVSDSWPVGCEFDPRLRRTFFLSYFRLLPLQKHVRKVGGFGTKSCVSTGVRKPGKHMCVTHRHDMTAVKVALNPNTSICRSRIRLHILSSLILIFIICKKASSHATHRLSLC